MSVTAGVTQVLTCGLLVWILPRLFGPQLAGMVFLRKDTS